MKLKLSDKIALTGDATQWRVEAAGHTSYLVSLGSIHHLLRRDGHELPQKGQTALRIVEDAIEAEFDNLLTAMGGRDLSHTQMHDRGLIIRIGNDYLLDTNSLQIFVRTPIKSAGLVEWQPWRYYGSLYPALTGILIQRLRTCPGEGPIHAKAFLAEYGAMMAKYIRTSFGKG